MPATSESTSSGSDSVLVMIRGLSAGSAERSHTWPRAFGRDEHGRDHDAVAVVLLLRRGPRSRRRPCGTGCRRRAARRGCARRRRPRRRSRSAGPMRRSSHSASGLRLVGAVAACRWSETSQMHRHERVVLEVAADARQLVAHLDARGAQLVGRRRCPRAAAAAASRSRPRRRITSRSARSDLARRGACA